MMTRCSSPPESWCGRAARTAGARCTSASMARMRLSSASFVSSAFSSAVRKKSRICMRGEKASRGSWKTMRTTPLFCTVPSSGSSEPAMMRKSVDFPEPLAPTMPQTSPGARRSDTPRKTSCLPRWVSKDFFTSVTSRSARISSCTSGISPALFSAVMTSPPRLPPRVPSCRLPAALP